MLLRRKLSSRVVVWTLASLAAAVVQADSSAQPQDEIILKNGSRILGTLTNSKEGVLTLETDFAGTLSIAVDQVKSVHSHEPVVVLKKDDSVVRETKLDFNEEDLSLATAGQSFPLEELNVLNPEPWELGQGYRWTGLVSFAVAMQRGNTDTDELDYKLESRWRSKADRYTLKADGEVDETNGQKTADNWKVVGKYDYFLEGPNYVGLVTSAEKDKFRDLDLRYLIGPYIGRQFYDEPVFTLSAEIGLSYVTEEYNVADDEDYGAGNWAINASSDWLGGDSRLYFDQSGLLSLEDTSDVVVDTTFGLAFPLLWGLEAAAEVLLEYDSGAVDDVDELDQTYKVRLGYAW